MGDIVEVNFAVRQKALEIKKKGRQALRAERLRVLKELTFDAEAIENGWSDEEKEAHWEEFSERYEVQQEEERRINRLIGEQLIFGGENLSPEERDEAENYIKDHPEANEAVEEVKKIIAEAGRHSGSRR